MNLIRSLRSSAGPLSELIGDLGDFGRGVLEVGGTPQGDSMSRSSCLLVAFARIVVLRCRFEVSAEGGGGRFDSQDDAGRIVARQRKHSPVP